MYQNLRQKGKKNNKHENIIAGKRYIPNRIYIEERPSFVDLKELLGRFGNR